MVRDPPGFPHVTERFIASVSASYKPDSDSYMPAPPTSVFIQAMIAGRVVAMSTAHSHTHHVSPTLSLTQGSERSGSLQALLLDTRIYPRAAPDMWGGGHSP